MSPLKTLIALILLLVLNSILKAQNQQENALRATARIQTDFTFSTKTNENYSYKNQAYGAAFGFQIQQFYGMYLGYSREILAISGNTEQTWQADNFVFGLEGHIPVYQQFYFTLGGSLTIQQIENFTWNGGTGGENQTHELLGFKAGPSWQNERFFAQAVFIYRQAGKSNLYLGDPYFLGAGLSFGVFLF